MLILEFRNHSRFGLASQRTKKIPFRKFKFDSPHWKFKGTLIWFIWFIWLSNMWMASFHGKYWQILQNESHFFLSTSVLKFHCIKKDRGPSTLIWSLKIKHRQPTKLSKCLVKRSYSSLKKFVCHQTTRKNTHRGITGPFNSIQLIPFLGKRLGFQPCEMQKPLGVHWTVTLFFYETVTTISACEGTTTISTAVSADVFGKRSHCTSQKATKGSI